MYYDPRYMGAPHKLWAHLVKVDPSLTLARTKAALRNVEYWQRTRRAARTEMPIIGRHGEYQCDYMFFYQHGKVRNVLTMINVTTRFALARVTPNLVVSQSVVPALADMFSEAKEAGQPVSYLVADNGFNTNLIKDLCRKQHIGFHFPVAGDKTTMGMIESFNMVLRKMLTQYVNTIGQNWDKALPQLLENYNTVPHTTTHMVPSETSQRDGMRIRGKATLRMRPALAALNAIPMGAAVRVSERNPVADPFQKFAPTFSKKVQHIDRQTGFSVHVGNQVMRPRNVRVIDERNLLPPPNLKGEPLTKSQAHTLRSMSRELKLIDATETQAVEAMTAPREPRVTRSTRAPRYEPPPMPAAATRRAARRPRVVPAGADPMVGIVERILGHREGAGGIGGIEFQVLWARRAGFQRPPPEWIGLGQLRLPSGDWNSVLKRYAQIQKIRLPKT